MDSPINEVLSHTWKQETYPTLSHLQQRRLNCLNKSNMCPFFFSDFMDIYVCRYKCTYDRKRRLNMCINWHIQDQFHLKKKTEHTTVILDAWKDNMGIQHFQFSKLFVNKHYTNHESLTMKCGRKSSKS